MAFIKAFTIAIVILKGNLTVNHYTKFGGNLKWWVSHSFFFCPTFVWN